jgi:hypothetical protein
MTATRTVDLDNLLGLAEIASKFDVPYSTALSWTRARGFPAPVKVFKMGPAWLYQDVADYRRQKEDK